MPFIIFTELVMPGKHSKIKNQKKSGFFIYPAAVASEQAFDVEPSPYYTG